MIQQGTNLNVADNTGAKSIRVIKVLGSSRRRYAYVGDIITASVKDAIPNGIVKKKEVIQAVIVRCVKPWKRPDGTIIRFDDNAAVIVAKESKEPRGTRIFGPIPREIREGGYQRIISLAPEVV